MSARTAFPLSERFGNSSVALSFSLAAKMFSLFPPSLGSPVLLSCKGGCYLQHQGVVEAELGSVLGCIT